MIPFWLELVVSGLLVLSGLFVLVSAIGYLRLRDFFLRMHPPALAYTFGSWTVALAGILFFSATEGKLVLYPGLIAVLLAVTVPVTTVMLARVELFRRRFTAAPGTPPSLTRASAAGAAGGHDEHVAAGGAEQGAGDGAQEHVRSP